MWTHPTAMEPMLPDRIEAMADLALELVQASAVASGQVHPRVLREIETLLRVVNSYYSNLIEGHNTHPADIMRAMGQDYATDPARRALQLESLAHIQVQQRLEQRLEAAPDLDVTAPEFLAGIHREFFQRLPEDFRSIRDESTGAIIPVEAGHWRTRTVQVGQHIPPPPESLPGFLQRFQQVYRPDRHHGHHRLIAAAAAHQRLAWIHPFLDGNGRVMRLFSDAYLRRIGLTGYGLWSVSRGLARNRGAYRSHLAQADQQRHNDFDGRGNLSMAGLRDWCHWFLEIGLDQARFTTTLLRLDRLKDRLQGYVRLRSEGLAPPPPEGGNLRPEMAVLLTHVLVCGEVPRGELHRLLGYSDRSIRGWTRLLLDEGLLKSDTPKGPVRCGFPPHAIPYLFPDLLPVQPD